MPFRPLQEVLGTASATIWQQVARASCRPLGDDSGQGCVAMSRSWWRGGRESVLTTPDRWALQRIVLGWAEWEIRDRSRLQVVPAKLLGEALLEVSGTEKAAMVVPDASGPGAFCRGQCGGSIHASPMTPCSAGASTLVVMMGTSPSPSAMSRKAVSLAGDSKTNSTWGRCPSLSR